MSNALQITLELVCLSPEELNSLRTAVYNAPSLFAYPADEILEVIKALQGRRAPSPASTRTPKVSSSSEEVGPSDRPLERSPAGSSANPVSEIFEKTVQSIPGYVPRSQGGPSFNGQPLKGRPGWKNPPLSAAKAGQVEKTPKPRQVRDYTPLEDRFSPEVLEIARLDPTQVPGVIPKVWHAFSCRHPGCGKQFLYPHPTGAIPKKPALCLDHISAKPTRQNRLVVIKRGLAEFGSPIPPTSA